MSSRTVRAPMAIAISTSIALGITIALLTSSPQALLIVTLLAAIPLIGVAASRLPEAVVGLIVFGLLFERFEAQTPVGTISPSIVALAIFFAVRFPEIVAHVGTPGYRLATLCLVAYVGAHGLQLLHTEIDLAARQFITPASFAAFAWLGMSVGSRRSYLVAIGIGATAALLLAATLALMANFGFALFSEGLRPTREILGVTSPFGRSYGVPQALIGLLLPLSVPFLALAVRFGHPALRIGSFAAITLIGLATVFLFQSRSMLLQVGVGTVFVWVLANRRLGPAIVIAGVFVGAALVVGLALVAGTDPISNQLRAESYSAAIGHFINNPEVLLLGTYPPDFRFLVHSGLTYGHLIPSGAPTHNILIETIVSGGLVAAAALVLLVLIPITGIARTARATGQFTRSMAAALVALLMATLEVSVTPGIANSGGFWIAVGWGVATATTSSARVRDTWPSTSRRTEHPYLAMTRG